MKTRYFVTSLLVLGLAVLFGAPSLQADPLPGSLQLRLSDGTNTAVITDQGSCSGACGAITTDINPVLGVVTWSGSIGSWTVNVTTGFGYPFRPQGTMDLNSINATSGPGGGTLVVQVTQVDFSANSPGFFLAAGGTIAGSGPGASATYSVSGGNTNNPFDTSNTLASLGPFSSPSFSGAVSSATGNSVNPYSLTLTTTIVASTSGVTTYSGDMHVSPVPEPTSVLLFGTGLAGLAFWSRRRSKARK